MDGRGRGKASHKVIVCCMHSRGRANLASRKSLRVLTEARGLVPKGTTLCMSTYRGYSTLKARAVEMGFVPKMDFGQILILIFFGFVRIHCCETNYNVKLQNEGVECSFKS